ncbi:MAG: hypothetical protein QM767_09255 [Anaeromyxobacter sp.]
MPDELEPLLQHSDYWYASGLAGLEFGSQRRLSFFLRAGVTRVWAEARGTGSSTSGGTTVSITDPTVTVTSPAVKLGLQLWF